MKPLRYVFYRIQQSEPKASGALAWIVPLFLIAMACALNVLSLVALLIWAMGKLPERLEVQDAKKALLLVLTAMLLVLYSRWIASGRYVQFPKEFRLEASAQRGIRTVLVYLYMFGSVATPIVIGYVAGRYR